MPDGFDVLLFDVDGVLLRPPAYFSLGLDASGYPMASQAIDGFYRSPEYGQCLLGFDDPGLVIQPWLRQMGWKRGSTAYLDAQYAYEGGFLDRALLEKVARLRKAGLPCWLATDQDSCRRGFLLGDLGLGPLFDGCFVSSLLHARKAMPDFWVQVLERLGGRAGSVDPGRILFIDDMPANLEAAAAHGIGTMRVSTPADIKLLHGRLEALIAALKER